MQSLVCQTTWKTAPCPEGRAVSIPVEISCRSASDLRNCNRETDKTSNVVKVVDSVASIYMSGRGKDWERGADTFITNSDGEDVCAFANL